MASNQRRTDDLRRLKTRALIYQYPNGTYPAQGSVPYITDTTGTMGWSPVTVDASGNEYVPGNLVVDGSGSFGGNVDVGGDLVVDLSGSFGGNLDVGGDLVVDLYGHFGGNLDVSGDITGHSDLLIDHSGHFGGNLDVSGDATIHGSTTLEGSLDMSGDITAAKLTIVGNPSEIDLQTTDAQMRLYAQNNSQVPGQSEGTVGIALPPASGGGWLAPTLTFDVSQSMIHIDPQLSNSENLPIMTLDNSGDVTVNGNITVNSTDAPIYNTGSVQGAYFTLPDLTIPASFSYLYEDKNQLLWESNNGAPQQLSGWNSILDPSGEVIDTIPDLSFNNTPLIASTLNKLLILLSSRNAFFTTTVQPAIDITFQTNVSMNVAVGPSSITLNCGQGTITLGPLLFNLNGSLTSASIPLQFVYSTLTKNVTLVYTGSSSFQIRDYTVNGSAYNFLNHMNIGLPLPNTYNTVSFNKSLTGYPIETLAIGGNPPPPAGTPAAIATTITQTSITISWTYTPTDISGFAVAQGGVTQAVVPSGTLSYTFSGLNPNTSYSFTVTPLSLYDAGFTSDPVTETTYADPPITFQSALSCQLVQNGKGWGLSVAAGTYAMSTLITSFTNQLSGSAFSIAYDYEGRIVTLTASSYPYTISDVSGPGSAFIFFQHMGITLPLTYPSTAISAILTGDTVPENGQGQTPPPAPVGTPVLTLGLVTPTSMTISWTYTETDVSGFAVSLTSYAGVSITKAIVSMETTSYTFTGLVATASPGVPYTLSVTPLSLYDAGTRGSLNKSMISNFVDIWNSGNFVAYPASNTPIYWYSTPSFALSGTLRQAIWVNQLSTLRNVNQIQNVTMNYLCAALSVNTAALNIKFNGPGVDPLFINLNTTFKLSGSSPPIYSYGSPYSAEIVTPFSPPPSYNTATFTTLTSFKNIFNSNSITGLIATDQDKNYIWKNDSERLNNSDNFINQCSMLSFKVQYVYAA